MAIDFEEESKKKERLRCPRTMSCADCYKLVNEFGLPEVNEILFNLGFETSETEIRTILKNKKR